MRANKARLSRLSRRYEPERMRAHVLHYESEPLTDNTQVHFFVGGLRYETSAKCFRELFPDGEIQEYIIEYYAVPLPNEQNTTLVIPQF